MQGGSTGGEAELSVALLTRHLAMFAGSGSGKTVLLRRIVEEAALAGIPSIVLDTNNDLARLGTPWPSPPDGWGEGDAAKAERYARDVDVVVWTPGVAAGRPLALPVLPDFALSADDEERAQAVDMAWATLTPLVGATGASKTLKEGLLKQALAAFAVEGRGGVEAFIDFLVELPAEVSKLRKADQLAADMGDQLRAKIAVNPLLGGGGGDARPGHPVHLRPAGRHPRVGDQLRWLGSRLQPPGFCQPAPDGAVRLHPALPERNTAPLRLRRGAELRAFGDGDGEQGERDRPRPPGAEIWAGDAVRDAGAEGHRHQHRVQLRHPLLRADGLAGPDGRPRRR